MDKLNDKKEHWKLFLQNTFLTTSINWDERLDQAVFAYKTSVHEPTMISPYEMLRKGIQIANRAAQEHLATARTRQSNQCNKEQQNWTPYNPEKYARFARP